MNLTIRKVSGRWHVLTFDARSKKFKQLSTHDTQREAEQWVVDLETQQRKAKRK